MPQGIRDKVAILGMGCSKFGERWDAGPDDLMVEAYLEAMQDAGIIAPTQRFPISPFRRIQPALLGVQIPQLEPCAGVLRFQPGQLQIIAFRYIPAPGLIGLLSAFLNKGGICRFSGTGISSR